MHLLARVAQRIERRFPKPGVAGSIPVASILPPGLRSFGAPEDTPDPPAQLAWRAVAVSTGAMPGPPIVPTPLPSVRLVAWTGQKTLMCFCEDDDGRPLAVRVVECCRRLDRRHRGAGSRAIKEWAYKGLRTVLCHS